MSLLLWNLDLNFWYLTGISYVIWYDLGSGILKFNLQVFEAKQNLGIYRQLSTFIVLCALDVGIDDRYAFYDCEIVPFSKENRRNYTFININKFNLILYLQVSKFYIQTGIDDQPISTSLLVVVVVTNRGVHTSLWSNVLKKHEAHQGTKSPGT